MRQPVRCGRTRLWPARYRASDGKVRQAGKCARKGDAQRAIAAALEAAEAWASREDIPPAEALDALLAWVERHPAAERIQLLAVRVLERAVMRLPLVRAIYPSVKQVTDFLLADRGAGQFQGSRVVAVQARHQGVWSIGLVTASGYGPINDAIKGNMVTVFIPSSPTALAGYVVVAHREQVVELPLKVEEALRLLISGGVLTPGVTGKPAPKAGGADVPAPGAVLLPGKTSAGNPVMVAVASPDVDPETVVSVSAGGDAPRTTAV